MWVVQVVLNLFFPRLISERLHWLLSWFMLIFLIVYPQTFRRRF